MAVPPCGALERANSWAQFTVTPKHSPSTQLQLTSTAANCASTAANRASTAANRLERRSSRLIEIATQSVAHCRRQRTQRIPVVVVIHPDAERGAALHRFNHRRR